MFYEELCEFDADITPRILTEAVAAVGLGRVRTSEAGASFVVEGVLGFTCRSGGEEVRLSSEAARRVRIRSTSFSPIAWDRGANRRNVSTLRTTLSRLSQGGRLRPRRIRWGWFDEWVYPAGQPREPMRELLRRVVAASACAAAATVAGEAVALALGTAGVVAYLCSR